LDKETWELIDGSPLVALNNNPAFDSFIFIDRDKKRFQECVQPLMTEFPSARIEPLFGDCNDVILHSVLPRFSGRDCPERGFIFLDPYGLQLRWDTVEAIAKSGVFDILVNFSVMGIYRQLGELPPEGAHRERITAVIGDDSWFNEAYPRNQQLSFLDDPRLTVKRRNEGLAQRLAECYRRRLGECFEHVSRAIMMYGPTGSPLYALILASHAKIAKKRMEEIFARQERRKNKKI